VTVVSVDSDLESLTLTIVAEFDAPANRVWELWSDPRRLERWWGPPGCDATFEHHDLSPGGQMRYRMALPDGRTSRGWWRVTSAEPPRSLEFVDGWAGEDGRPLPDMPTTTARVLLAERDGRTRMEVRSTFGSSEQMQQVLDMGAAEAFAAAVGQMDALLAG